MHSTIIKQYTFLYNVILGIKKPSEEGFLIKLVPNKIEYGYLLLCVLIVGYCAPPFFAICRAVFFYK